MIYDQDMDNDPDDEYTFDDLRNDLEAMRKAGIIEVSGISDDGQWVYSMTDFGRKIYDDIKDADPESVAETLEGIIRNSENEEY